MDTKIISMLTTQDDLWKEVCNKVVGDALFEKKSIIDTVEYLVSKYKIEKISSTQLICRFCGNSLINWKCQNEDCSGYGE